MNRQTALLAALAAILIVVLGFVFVVQPRRNEIADVKDQIEEVQTAQRTTETQIAALQDVRARSPELEAELAAGNAVIPEVAALPAALRQLQVAADDSGVTLATISAARPERVTDTPDSPPELARINLSLTVTGGYFQIVDFLRRIEDPLITPRGVLWGSLSLAPETYPTLTGTISGTMFAVLEDGAAVAEEEPPSDGAAEGADDADPGATETETEEAT